MTLYSIDKTVCQKPVSLKPIVANVPIDLQKWPHWVNWKYEYRKGQSKPWTKVPFNPKTGHRAGSTYESTWAEFATAVARYEQYGEPQGQLEGIGFVVNHKCGVVGIDLDKCVKDGVIEPWAMDIIHAIDSYAEFSPSGSGIRILAFGTLPEDGRKRDRVEVYDAARYLTITGHHIPDSPKQLQARTDQIAAFHKQYFPKDQPKNEKARKNATTNTMEYEEILNLLRNEKEKGAIWAKLWKGDWEECGYKSHSEADQALCNKLAFYVGPDEDKIREVFASSGLYREKWDRDDYALGTIAKAIDGCDSFYEDVHAKEQGIVDIFNAMGDGQPVVSSTAKAPMSIAAELGTTEAQLSQAAAKASEAAERDAKQQFHTLEWWRKNVQRRPWLIKNWLKLGETCVIWGPTGSCKSFLALDMALSICTRTQFAGQPVRPGTVVYVYTESLDGALIRVDAWKQERGIAADPANFHLTPHRYQFMDDDCGEQIVRDIRKQCGDMPIDLVIIDTLSKCFNGGDENSAELAQVEQALAYVRDMTGATAVVIHHTGKQEDRGERGHSSLRANVDSSIGCSPIGQDPDDGEGDMRPIKVWNAKAKESLGGKCTVFERKIIKLGEDQDQYTGHEDITSLVMVPITGEDAKAKQKAKEKQVKLEECIKCLDLLPDSPEKAVTPNDWMDDAKITLNVPVYRLKEYLAMGKQYGWVELIMGNRTAANPNRIHTNMQFKMRQPI